MGTVGVSFAIMAHPKRKEFVDHLSSRLGVDHVVVWDKQNNRWETGRRSLMAYDRKASHHVVVQDDAVLCENFAQACHDLSFLFPDNPVCFYFGRGRRYRTQMSTLYAESRATGAQFIARPGPHWGVAIMLPSKHIRSIAVFGDQRTDISNYDLKIAAWYLRQKTLCWYTVPCLVDHRDETKYGPNPSLVVGRIGRGRTAINFVGENVDASKIKWKLSKNVTDNTSLRYYW